MRTAVFLCGALVGVCGSVSADWTIKTESTFGGHPSVSVEYYKDNLVRGDYSSGDGHEHVFVSDPANHRTIAWDVAEKKYSITSIPQGNGYAAYTRDRDTSARPILSIEETYTDTGERQTIQGRTTRHVITGEKRWRQESAGTERKLESESTTDGWYAEVPGLPREKTTGRGSGFILVDTTDAPTPVIHTHASGTPPTGLAVRETRKTSAWLRPDLPEHAMDSEMKTEVTELSDAPLSPQLFQPPAGFQKVDQLNYRPRQSFSDEIEIYWNNIQRWFAGLFS